MEQREIVRRVIDGDTFETEGGGSSIRLLNVYSPALHDYLGKEARRHLMHLMWGDRVTVNVVGRDPYGRRLAWVKCNGVSVNRAMREYLDERGLIPPAEWLKHHTRPEI